MTYFDLSEAPSRQMAHKWRVMLGTQWSWGYLAFRPVQKPCILSGFTCPSAVSSKPQDPSVVSLGAWVCKVGPEHGICQ